MRQEILRVRHADAQHRVRREHCNDEPQQLRQIGADVVSVGARVLRREPHLHYSLCISTKQYMVIRRFEIENGPVEREVYRWTPASRARRSLPGCSCRVRHVRAASCSTCTGSGICDERWWPVKQLKSSGRIEHASHIIKSNTCEDKDVPGGDGQNLNERVFAKSQLRIFGIASGAPPVFRRRPLLGVDAARRTVAPSGHWAFPREPPARGRSVARREHSLSTRPTRLLRVSYRWKLKSSGEGLRERRRTIRGRSPRAPLASAGDAPLTQRSKTGAPQASSPCNCSAATRRPRVCFLGEKNWINETGIINRGEILLYQ